MAPGRAAVGESSPWAEPATGSGPNGIARAVADPIPAFDRRKADGDYLPLSVARQLPRAVVATSLLRALTLDETRSVWIGRLRDRTRQGICILLIDIAPKAVTGNSCGPVNGALFDKGTAGVVFDRRGGRVSVFGFAPGATRVTIAVDRLSTTSAKVGGGVYGATLSRFPASVSWRVGRSTVTHAFAPPPQQR